MTTRALTPLLLASALILGGCQRAKSANANPDSVDSALVTSYKLIDDGREDEAVAVLERELAKSPGPDEAGELTTAMASAYAHKAGIRVQSFAPLLDASRNKVNFSLKPAVHKGKIDSKAADVDVLMTTVAGLIASFRVVIGYYTAIPTVTKDKEPYLEYAVRLMDSLGKNATPGQAIYRAVIKVVYLKAFLASNVFDEGSREVEVDPNQCRLDVDQVSSSLMSATHLSVDIIDDIMIAQPSKAKGLSRMREDIVNTASDLTMALGSVSLIDSTTQMLLSSQVLQQGMRKLLKCREVEKSAPAQAPSAPASSSSAS